MQSVFSRRSILLVCLLFAIAMALPGTAASQECAQPAGTAVSVQGSVEAQRSGQAGWQPVQLNDTFCPGDTIRVGENSRANLALANQSVLRLDAGSQLKLEGISEERTSRLDMLKGAAHFFSRQPRGLEVKTPYTIAGVRGTEFLVTIEQGRTLLSVYEGAVLAQNEAGSLTLQSGQSAVAEAGKAPVLRVVAKPRDAVQWALYFPPVIYTAPGAAAPSESDPRFYVQRASQLLAVGRVEQANSLIQQALSLDANFADAFALQTIILIVQNNPDGAMQAANRAVSADANSATARIAMSYAQQARFDLEGARVSLEEAVKLAPDNALAWARLAEIWASFGRLGRSLDAAKKAVAIDPNLSRTQTVLGFAYLTQVKTRQAREAFEKAISLDQADPLPRLGLGLAIIRDGKLRQGGEQIEIAASLDPNNSLIRSYMGKTYYEEKRTSLDQREYEIAKELDPNDPTPWFYDAIAKQTTNRPVEALRDFQTAKELNDNRAVYRSKLLLDSDLAARSAATARIYNDLGFGQLGLVEGYNSVNNDPTNFSAHRFLSDTYATLPRHEIARVSELLQSQLLQPINITPIQPGLAESNLFLISSQGAGQPSFNEFNPLFTRNRAALQASGLLGENSTWGGEGIVSGIYKGLSLSAGYTGFETDGFRINNDQKDDIANVFAQWEATYKTSIQAEYRNRKTENGDLQLRFFKNDFLPNFREEEESKSIRLGIRHAFSPGSILLGNFAYQDAERSTTDQPIPSFDFDLKGDDKALSGELQYLLRATNVNLVTGGGYFDIDRKDNITTVVTPPPIIIPQPPPLPPIVIQPPPVTTITEKDLGVKHSNIYLYSYLYLPKHVTITLGASGDFFDSPSGSIPDENQFNPKFGIQWNPLKGTTLRGAAFRAFKRTLITDQTLEPTQVAGFNQFYDDANATDSWRYGLAIDQKFSNSVFGGLEYSQRDLTVPFLTLTTPSQPSEADWEEKLGRAYFSWTPATWLALTADYLYEDFERKGGIVDGAKEVETHYVPLGARFFIPLGLSFGVSGTYVNQDGSFERRGSPGVFERGKSDFWLIDAAINYRLPKRYGFFTVGASNLFDKIFQYFDTDRDNPRIQPERNIFAKLTLAFP